MTQIESLESSVFYKRFLKERRRIISSTSLLTEGSSVKTDDNDDHKKWVVCVPQSRSLKARNITRRDVGTLNGEASFIVTLLLFIFFRVTRICFHIPFLTNLLIRLLLRKPRYATTL